MNKSKYKSASDWYNNSPAAYNAAKRTGILEDICIYFGWKLPKKIKRFEVKTIDMCKQDAIQYKTPNEWKKANPINYNYASSKGWLNECCSHMRRTLDMYLKIAYKYKTPGEWKNNDLLSYKYASRKGWLKECCAHMNVKQKITRTLNDCIMCASKYTKSSEWEKYDEPSYQYATKKGWLKECKKHFKKS